MRSEPSDESGGETQVAKSGRGGVLLLLFLAAAATLWVAALVVHLPERVKLLGLLPIAFGLVCGWLIVHLHRMLKVSRRPYSIAVSICLAAAGFAYLTVETFQDYRGELDDAFRETPLSLPESRIVSERDAFNEGLRESVRDTLAANVKEHERKRRFAAFLQRRWQAVGHFSESTALAVWILEIVAAGTAAGCIVWRVPSGQPSVPADLATSAVEEKT